MFDKQQIITLLRIHDLSAESPDDHIREVLSRAQYKAEEIDQALEMLRSDVVLRESRSDGLFKIYRTDELLQPKEISDLLGVDVEVTDLQVKTHRARTLTGSQNFVVLGLALILAASGLVYAMYEHKTGPFHPTVTAFSR